MGSGKSTVGRLLAERLGMAFVDIDSVIEEREGTAISDIFATKGEKYFRSLERKVLEEVAGKEGLVVSTGGGLGADRENMDLMKRTGLVVWLDVPLFLLMERLKGDDTRPLLRQPVDRLEELYRKRKEVYRLADLKVDGSKPAEKVVQEIVDGYLHRYRHR